jgi:putative ABC transport system substrate-binding protein
MKNNHVIVVLTVVIAISIGIYYQSHKKKLSLSAKGYRIALLVPAIHPAMDEIEQGIRDTMSTVGTKPYQLDIYNGNANKTLIRSQAEEIVNGGYDLVYAIGTGCAHLLAELTKKKGSSLPVVFTAVDTDPVALGIVPSLESSGSNVTGCIVMDDFKGQIAALVALKPNMHSILFVYDPSHGPSMGKKKEEIEKALATYGIQLKAVEVFSTAEITQKVASQLPGIDAVLVYTDHVIVAGMDALISLCNKYHVTLYASDLNSADKGAVLAYGVREYDHGVCAAHKGLKILEGKKLPRDIPITPVTDYRLKINTQALQAQNMALDKNQLDTFVSSGGLLVTVRPQ